MAAHKNASTNPNAVFQNKGLTTEAFEAAPMLTTPVQLFDACPTCDGAATVVLTANKDAARRGDGSVIRIAGSGAATDVLPVRERANPLHLTAVELSTEQALWQAELSRDDLDIFELHDAYGIMACLSLESAGFTPAGTGLDYAAAGNIDLTGATPIATFGGLKARGHPVGATGVYQAAETFLQLTRNAGLNQVEGASTALVQNIGGAGSSVFTHALVRE
jgi:acetyl-CoA C-acetyltransferase